MPISALYIFTGSWHYGLFICQGWIGVDYTASTASIFNLFILSLDRYWSVTNPLKYLHQRTKRRALIMIASVWFTSSLWIIPILGWHHFATNGVRIVPYDVCDTEYATNTSLKIITSIINYFLPLGVMYTLYGKIFHEIRKRSKLEIGQKNTTRVLQKDTSVSENSDSPHYAVYTPSKNSVSARNDNDNNETEEELLKLHPTGDNYTTSDSDRNHYVYDETVVDQTTEQLQRFFYTDKLCVTNNNDDRTAETSLCSFPNSPVFNHHNYKTKERVRLNVPNNHEPPKTPHIFPKEFHPAKNQYVSKPVRRSEPDTPPAAPSTSLLEVPKRIERSLSTRSRKSRGRSIKKSGVSALSKEIKAARQLGVIMGAFTACFFPYFICFLLVPFCENCVPPQAMTIVTWIGYLNSTLNPVLYPLCNLHFRRKFRKMLHFRAKTKKKDIYGQTRLTHNNTCNNYSCSVHWNVVWSTMYQQPEIHSERKEMCLLTSMQHFSDFVF